MTLSDPVRPPGLVRERVRMYCSENIKHPLLLTGRDNRYHSGRGCSELYFSARLMRNSFKWIKGETEIARHRIYANLAGFDVIKTVN